MKNIEVKVLNPESINQAEQMMVCAARLTQHGHTISNMADFEELYNKSYTEKTVKTMTELPHPTIQKFAVINVAIIGASRRFLAQITRHQNEVKFMSASLQYSDYSDNNAFVVPYNVLQAGKTEEYLKQCQSAMAEYKNIIANGLDNDSAGYIAPQGLRNILIISATPYQWKHMISQRSCRRNTDETRYVMLKIWELLYNINPIMFAPKTTGPFCMQNICLEGKMGCSKPLEKNSTPSDILNEDFPLLIKEST